jgi:hypothetical protein
MRIRFDRQPLAAALILLAAACSGTGSGLNMGQGHLLFSVSAQRPTTATSAADVTQSGDSTVVVLGSDSVIVRSVDLVLRRIELKAVTDTSCEAEHEDGMEHAGTSPEDATQGPEHDDCDEIKAGPVLVSLPLGAIPTEAMVDVPAPEGQYDRLEFRIHVPQADSADSAFLVANPDFQGVSIRVTGTFSQAGTRTDFTLLSDLEASQEVPIDPPISVAAGSMASVTLRFDVSGWFLNATGDGLVDPASASAGGPNESVVRENIQRSINAFRDENHDGHDDSGEHMGGSGGGHNDG